jgi:uncharacterized membrane protein YidH (DUF202 family)
MAAVSSREPDPSSTSQFGDPSRRTYLATERTLLAWWRTAFASVGVALAVGRLVPQVAHLPTVPFLGLGAGWGVLAVAFLVAGSVRQRRGRRAIAAGGFVQLDQRVTDAFSLYILLLIVATVVMFSAYR